MNKARFFKVKSFHHENYYTVRNLPTGEWKCSCPYFVFKQRLITKCDHIRKVQHLKLKNHGRKKKEKN